ncbi:MAG: hypothetical protein QG622_207 [Actinomycetota bacterium]|nr:hypothetical protein [Actinomycetota bacterium]
MALTVAAAPNGLERMVAPDELFFSTTDRRGVIRSGNSVFVRISQFSVDELTGAPHNVVRHPDMPRGAYRLMWDRLLDGRPVGAYIQNLSKDGSHYWVFATVTPLNEGFLSVRMAPCARLFEEIRNLYAAVRTVENERAENERLDRHAVAEIGATMIDDHLRSLGFATYDDFILDALPAEVAARARLATTSYARTWVRGPLAEIMAGVTALDDLLATQVERLEGYRMLCDDLLGAAFRVLEMSKRLDRAVTATRVASETVAESAPVLLNVAAVMAQPMGAAVGALEELAPRLRRLRTDLTDLRFRVALVSLHNDMVAAFAAEVADGVAPARSLQEVPKLCDVLNDGVIDLGATAAQVNRDLLAVADLVLAAGELFDDFRRFLGQWRLLVMRHRAGDSMTALLRPIDEEISVGHAGIELLRTLGLECRGNAVPVEPVVLETQVTRIRMASVAAW